MCVFELFQNDDFMYILYNDEDPDKKELRDRGHSKGLLKDVDSIPWFVGGILYSFLLLIKPIELINNLQILIYILHTLLRHWCFKGHLYYRPTLQKYISIELN